MGHQERRGRKEETVHQDEMGNREFLDHKAPKETQAQKETLARCHLNQFKMSAT